MASVQVSNKGVIAGLGSDGNSNVSNLGLISFGPTSDVNNSGLTGTSEPLSSSYLGNMLLVFPQ